MKTVVTVALVLCALPLMAYVPEPQPVKSVVEITALYYPGTEQMSEWDMIAQTCPERKPLLGWYDEGNPEAIDWQIKWAVEHGISSFCVDWYWNKGFRRLEHWVKGYYKARYRKYLKWYMMYANHNQPGAHSTEDQIAVTKYWIDHYFKTPEYYTIDGKPVVCYWASGNLDRDFIAEAEAKGEELKKGEGIKRAFAISERMAQEAGLPGIHWQIMYGDLSEARKVGFSSGITYGYIPKRASKSETLTYEMVMEGLPKTWAAKSVRWLPIPTGWDDRPRSFANARVIRGRTPEKFAAICREARAFCDKNGIRHAIIHPMQCATHSARSRRRAGRRTFDRPTRVLAHTTIRRSSVRQCRSGSLPIPWEVGTGSRTAAANLKSRMVRSTSGSTGRETSTFASASCRLTQQSTASSAYA